MAASVASGGPSLAGVDQFRLRVCQAARVLLTDQDQLSLAEVLVTLTMQVPSPQFHDAIRLLNAVDTRGVFFHVDPSRFMDFRRSINVRAFNLIFEARARRDEEDERMISEAFPHIVLRAARQAAGLIPRDDDQEMIAMEIGAAEEAAAGLVPPDDDDDTTQPYANGGFGAVPASGAAVRSLEKQTFHAAGRAGESESVANGDCGITECSICFDEFEDGAQVTVMPCPSRGHRFHLDCIAKWLGISNMCPLCRHKLPLLN